MKEKHPSGHLKRTLLFFLLTAALWAIYSLAVHLLAIWIFWVYVGLFAAGAILFTALTRGHLAPPSEVTPPGLNPTEYAAYREKILALRRRYAPLLYLSIAALICILFDYINLTWFDGKFL